MEWTRPKGRPARPDRGCACVLALLAALSASGTASADGGRPPDVTPQPRAVGSPPASHAAEGPAPAYPAELSARPGSAVAPPGGAPAGNAPDAFERQPAFGPPAAGAPGASAPEAADPDGTPGLFSVVGWTVLVVAALLVCMRLLRGLIGGRRLGVPGSAIRVLGRKTLEPHVTLYLVEVGKTVLRLGVTRTGVSLLGEVTDADDAAYLRTLAPGAGRESVVGAFQSALHDHLGAAPAAGPPGAASWPDASPPENFGGVKGEIQKIGDLVRSWRVA